MLQFNTIFMKFISNYNKHARVSFHTKTHLDKRQKKHMPLTRNKDRKPYLCFRNKKKRVSR